VIEQPLLEEGGADQVEPVSRHPHDRGFQLDPAAAVEHVGQRDADPVSAAAGWRSAGRAALRRRASTSTLVKAEMSMIPARSRTAAFGGHHVVHHRAAEAVMVALFDAVRANQRGRSWP
jgi:hypothetical protein